MSRCWHAGYLADNRNKAVCLLTGFMQIVSSFRGMSRVFIFFFFFFFCGSLLLSSISLCAAAFYNHLSQSSNRTALITLLHKRDFLIFTTYNKWRDCFPSCECFIALNAWLVGSQVLEMVLNKCQSWVLTQTGIITHFHASIPLLWNVTPYSVSFWFYLGWARSIVLGFSLSHFSRSPSFIFPSLFSFHCPFNFQIALSWSSLCLSLALHLIPPSWLYLLP